MNTLFWVPDNFIERDGALYPITNAFVKKNGTLYPVTDTLVSRAPEVPSVDFVFIIYGSSYIIDEQTNSGAGTPNYTVDWGDGTQTIVSGSGVELRTHTYPYEGYWTITILDYVSGGITFSHLNSADYRSCLRRVLMPFPESARWRFYACFYRNTKLEYIPENLFANNPLATNFLWCFSGCIGLESIPPNIFANNSLATNFGWCFSDCSGLKTIPSDLFANCLKATSFSSCFYNDYNITSILGEIFRNCPNVTTFNRCFYGCSALNLIPQRLFANCPEVKTFARCFYGCIGLRSLPIYMFSDKPKATDFSRCFEGCNFLYYSSSDILPNLFFGCTAATTFAECFRGCYYIPSIPAELFSNCPNVTTFNGCFINSAGMKSIDILLHPDVLARDTDYAYMFHIFSSLYSHEGRAPELWESATVTSGYKKAFSPYNTKLINFNDIPDDWKHAAGTVTPPYPEPIQPTPTV